MESLCSLGPKLTNQQVLVLFSESFKKPLNHDKRYHLFIAVVNNGNSNHDHNNNDNNNYNINHNNDNNNYDFNDNNDNNNNELLFDILATTQIRKKNY